MGIDFSTSFQKVFSDCPTSSDRTRVLMAYDSGTGPDFVFKMRAVENVHE